MKWSIEQWWSEASSNDEVKHRAMMKWSIEQW
jgi:hypothetical protein